ncbi:MAG TPA: hypothetical protein VJU59_33180, partial [Paraburkholderia sp.]|uniref:hypothetical protein n=1 Tax=Paraburkholderia sp. TaxID=1926495 RepID=UPI002B4A8F29
MSAIGKGGPGASRVRAVTIARLALALACVGAFAGIWAGAAFAQSQGGASAPASKAESTTNAP